MIAWATRRWRGEVPRQTLLWRDMLLVGTGVNLLLTAAGLATFAITDQIGWAVALHFAPLPYNLFLVACVWRLPPASTMARPLALVWLVAVLVV
ncbi:MAG: hypothetical protein ACI83N_000319 [Hydrogenophaga sp.]|jgi:hypothetical protein